MSLTHVSGAIAGVQTFTFTFTFIAPDPTAGGITIEKIALAFYYWS